MRHESDKHIHLIDRLSDKPPLISQVEKRLQRDERIGINIGMQEGLMLKSYCSLTGVNKVVEIGTQYGCSASWMAMGLGDSGTIWTFEKDETAIQEAKQTFADPEFIKLGCKVSLIEGSALENLPSIEDQGPFDMIFIDANKSGYFDYWSWAKKHIREGGFIIADNVYLFGSVFEAECPEKTPVKMWRVMNQMLEDAFKDSNFHSCLIPTEEGLLFSTRVK